MKSQVVLIITILLPLLTFGDFYRPANVPSSLRPTGFDYGRSAALMIESGKEVCSATQVSQEGYILTALHCIASCVKMTKVSSIKGFKAQLPKSRTEGSCTLKVSREGQRLGTMKSKIVALGYGYVELTQGEKLEEAINSKPKLLPSFSQLMAAGVGVSGDYAILYVPSLANRNCVRAGSEPSLKARLWNIAYPAKSSRPNGNGTPGDIAVFSTGFLERGSVYPATSLIQNGKEARLRILNRPGILITSVDSNVGSSGSGVFNETGEVVAVFNSSLQSVSNMSSVGTSGGRLAVSVDRIRSELTVLRGSNEAAKVFSCN